MNIDSNHLHLGLCIFRIRMTKNEPALEFRFVGGGGEESKTEKHGKVSGDYVYQKKNQENQEHNELKILLHKHDEKSSRSSRHRFGSRRPGRFTPFFRLTFYLLRRQILKHDKNWSRILLLQVSPYQRNNASTRNHLYMGDARRWRNCAPRGSPHSRHFIPLRSRHGEDGSWGSDPGEAMDKTVFVTFSVKGKKASSSQLMVRNRGTLSEEHRGENNVGRAAQTLQESESAGTLISCPRSHFHAARSITSQG